MAYTDQFSEDQERKVYTILVVEDDDDIGEFLVDALKMELPCQVLLATDASQALDMVQTVLPDLFLLDYQLPGIDGLELADRFRATEAFKHVPILLMSASIPKQKVEKYHIAFMEKPFEVANLIQMIENLLPS